MILHLVCDFFIIRRNCYKNTRCNSVHIFHNTMLLQNTAILFQLIGFIQALYITCNTMPANYIRNQTGRI